MDLFDCMPIAALVANKYLAMHGGISPKLEKLADIDSFSRFKEVPLEGLVCDLLWSDPASEEQCGEVSDFEHNEDRDCSFVFGKQAVKKVLDANSLTSILRAHQVQVDGYKMHRFEPPKTSKKALSTSVVSSLDFPSVVTIFSAPNYCGSYDNKGAFFSLDRGQVKIK